MGHVRLSATLAVLGVVVACDLDGGEPAVRPATVIWQAPLPAFGPPAVDDSSVFFSTQDHRLAAVRRASGSIRWVASTGITGHILTIQHRPARAGSVVVIGDENLYAFRALTGALVWSFIDDDARVGIYPFKTDGVRVYAGSVTGSVLAIDGETGVQAWRTELRPGTDNQVRVMAVRDGRVFVNMRYDGLAYSGLVFALDASTGATLWTFELQKAPGLRNGTTDAVFATRTDGTTMYVVSFDDGRIVALNPSDGTPIWTIPRPSTLLSTNDSRRLATARDVLVATQLEPNQVVGYDLGSGSELWKDLSDWGSITAVLTADSDFAYMPFSNGYLGAYDLKSGTRRWVRTPPAGLFYSGPVSSNDTLFLGAWNAAFAIRREQ